jgi:hypothetical protein
MSEEIDKIILNNEEEIERRIFKVYRRVRWGGLSATTISARSGLDFDIVFDTLRKWVKEKRFKAKMRGNYLLYYRKKK